MASAAAAGSFIFIGNVQSSEFQEARETALVLKKKVPGLKIEILELFELEWADKLEEYQRVRAEMVSAPVPL
jgi:hypothetical protein